MLESFFSPNPVTILQHLHWIINSWKAKDFSVPPSPVRWGNTPISTKSMHDFRIFNVLFPYKLETKFHESSKISPKQKCQWLEPNQRKHITRSKGRITQIIVDKEPETVRERTASWSQEAISLDLNLAFPATTQKGTDNPMSLSWLPLTRCIYSPWSGTLANTNIHNLNILSGYLTACDRHVLRSLVCLHLQYSSLHTVGSDCPQRWHIGWYYISILKALVINTRLPFVLFRCWQNPIHCARVMKLLLIWFII